MRESSGQAHDHHGSPWGARRPMRKPCCYPSPWAASLLSDARRQLARLLRDGPLALKQKTGAAHLRFPLRGPSVFQLARGERPPPRSASATRPPKEIHYAKLCRVSHHRPRRQSRPQGKSHPPRRRRQLSPQGRRRLEGRHPLEPRHLRSEESREGKECI